MSHPYREPAERQDYSAPPVILTQNIPEPPGPKWPRVYTLSACLGLLIGFILPPEVLQVVRLIACLVVLLFFTMIYLPNDIIDYWCTKSEMLGSRFPPKCCLRQFTLDFKLWRR